VYTIIKIKLDLFYNDQETSYFNLYKSRSLARMVALGHRLCGRKPEYLEKTHVVEQVMTLTIPHTTSGIKPTNLFTII